MFEEFTVIPSIDLKNGEVVRLLRGAMEHATIYGSDPAAVARLPERRRVDWVIDRANNTARLAEPPERGALIALAGAAVPRRGGAVGTQERSR